MTELYCTYDQDREEWVVWFPHPLGGKSVLETFDNENQSRYRFGTYLAHGPGYFG